MSSGAVGETDLSVLLRSMRPELHTGIFVFATLPPGQPVPTTLAPVMLFREVEGTTLILTEDEARGFGLAHTFRCRLITLTVHSSLDAVGFLAAITTRLATAGMSVNPVSAFHHDHLFVPANRAEEALDLLNELVRT